MTYTYGDAAWGDLLTAYDGVSITYDMMGNPLTDGTWTYTWEHGRQLASMTDGTTTWTYTYDANGLRTSRSNGTDTYSYVYNGSRLMQMKKGAYTLDFTYDASGNPSTVTLNGATYYYITNLQGDVTEIRDSSGNLVCEYSYDAWGKVISRSYSSNHLIDDLNPLLYRGYVYDTDTGLYYLQSRYYNPEIGRFLNADALVSTGQGVLGCNMFAYCGNNAVNCSDPNGLCANCLVQKKPREVSAVSLGGCSGAAAGVMVGVVAISVTSSIAHLSYDASQALKDGVAAIYEYARSLMDYSISIYENSQPRVHHVIPAGDFSRYGKEITNQLVEMRELLASVGMTVNSPENLIIISHGSHKSLHTKIYINNIYRIMMTAEFGNEASIRWALYLARQYAGSLDQYSFRY